MEAQFNPDAIFPGAARPSVALKDITALTAELTRVMAEETALLKEQRVRDTEALHPRKLQLIQALEVMKRELDAMPELKANFSEQEIAEFRQVSEIFSGVMVEYYRRLTLSRAVNSEIIRVIVEAVTEQVSMPVYGSHGEGSRSQTPVHLRLNETI